MAISFEVERRDFVVVGEWYDEEYAALHQRATTQALSREDLLRLVAGPRRHPFGAGAEEVLVDGRWVVYREVEPVPGDG